MSTPSAMWTSTVSSNFERFFCLSQATAFLTATGPSLANSCRCLRRRSRSFLPRRGPAPGRFPFFLVGSPAAAGGAPAGGAAGLAAGGASAGPGAAGAGTDGAVFALGSLGSRGFLGSLPFSLAAGLPSAVAGAAGVSSGAAASVFCFFAMSGSTLNRYSHAPGSAFDNADRVVHVAGIEILNFLLGDFAHLGRLDLEPLVLPAPLGLFLGGDDLAPLFLFQGNAGRLLEEHRRGRALHLKGKAPVGKHGNDHGYRNAAHLLGAVVELGHEGADIDAMLAQGWTDGRSGGRLPSRNLETNLCGYLFCHGIPSKALGIGH